MALGDIKYVNNIKKSICLMFAQATATTPPTLGTDGFPAYPIHTQASIDSGAHFTGTAPYRSVLTVFNSAGAGSLTGTFTLYGFLTAAGRWFPIRVNSGNAIAGTDQIRYQETFLYTLAAFDRFFLDVQAPGGTGQTFEAWLTTIYENA